MTERAYGTDETEEFDTLAEAEWGPDGLIAFRVVQIDKRAEPHA